jgi:hypothetical protein
MSVKKTIEIEAIAKDAVKKIEELTGQVENLEAQLKDTNKTSKKVAKGVGAIGTSLKAAGIGLIIAAFAKLTEVFNENQKVTNIFNTAFEALSLAFNDLFNFLGDNVPSIINFFKGIFNDPQQALSDFGTAIKNNLIERFNSFLDTLGYIASAVKKVFSGDFTGALEDVKKAGKESLDILTGVDNTFDKSVETVKSATNAVVNYTKETIKQAASTVDLNRKADVSIAKNRIILEQKDREAEKLRQIRDDESKTIEDRIKANNDLAKVLDEQEKLMLANANAVIAAAQAQFDKNANDQNQIALLEAQAEKEGILAQVEGFRSEQLINVNSLLREQEDLKKEAQEKDLEREEFLKEFQDQKALTEKEKKELELQEKEAEALKELELLEGTEAQKQQVREFFDGEQQKLEQEELKRKDALEKQKLAITANTLGDLAQLLGENSVAGKAAAIAQAIINSYLGFTEVLSSESVLPEPFGSIQKGISAASILASGLQTVKQITSVQTPNIGGGAMRSGGARGSTAAPTPAAPPAFNVVGASETNQLAEAISAKEQKPVKAFVVSSDVSNAQSLDRNIIETASIG